MSDGDLTLVLVHEVFPSAEDAARLPARLRAARELGAELAVLPELPLNRWAPATREVDDSDAEPEGGPRARAQAAAAAEAGIALLGGAIVRDAKTGRRHNAALLFDAAGKQLGSYRKLHLPDEPGFWEAHHYEPGEDPPQPIAGLPLSVGVQICSDVNRPSGSQLLAARGTEVIFVPRATPPGSYERWRCILRANAITACAYVVSTNRPRPEGGAPIGGPSLAIAPDGELLVESTDALSLVTLRREVVATARTEYPGYLATRAGLYARAWSTIG